MPSERHRSKEDTWSTNELKRALNKDDIRKEREKLKRDRRERDGRDEEEIDTRKREGHRRREDDDRKERRRHDEDKRQNKDDDRRRKDEDRRSHRTDNDEEERERQRRERREKREGKSSRDTKEREQSKRKEEEESRSQKRHRDTDDKRSRDHDDRRRRRDEEDEDEKERRRQEERERRRKEKEGDKRNKERDRDRDRDDRRQTNGDSDDRHRRHKDQDRDQRREKKDRHRDEEDERDRRRDRRDRDDDDEDERERQRRERREKREGKDKDKNRKTKDEEEEERRRRKDKERREREERERREREERERQERQKSHAQEDDDYNDYEDDFEDYDDDFEDDDEDVPAPPRRSKSPDPRHIHKTTPHGGGRALDYDDNEVDEVLRALDQENERLLTESRQDRYDTPESNEYRRGRYRDDDEDNYNDDRGDYGTSHQTPSASSSGLINFSGAKKQVMSRKANSKMEKRAADLLQMLELDVARYDMFDLPPVKEYELYIRNFGRTDAQQAYVQTNDDNIDRDVQTEEIDTRSKWTQHPAHDSTGCGRGDGKKDLDEEEVELQQNKVYDLSRLNKFVEQAGQVIAILLEEEREMSNSHESRGENRSNMAVSEGFSELNLLSLLKDRYVEFTHFSPSQPNHLLTVYSKPTQMDESNPVCNKGMICVWNTNDPSYPQRILACESQPVCCCFSPYRATLVFAGMVDGSVCAWDLREPPSLHQTLQYQDTQHIVRFPTYNTAGVMDAENHHSPITTLNPVVSSTDREPDTSDSTDESLGLSFQLVSCEEQGVINFWVVAEISSPDMAGSEVDLGLSPGGRVKLVRSSVISLQSPVSKGSGTVRSFELQLSPQDPNHFYVGTEGGYILHGVRFGSRAFPRTFSAITDAPADVQTLDFSPFGHPCFLASSADGAVHLFNSKTDSPVVTWPSKTWGGSFVRCVRWSRTRPCVFYVLDDASHLYTFDFLEGDVLPAKIDTLSSSNKAVSMSLTDHRLQDGTEGHSSRLPQMVVSFENGSVEVHTISKEYRELQTLEDEFIPSYLARF